MFLSVGADLQLVCVGTSQKQHWVPHRFPGSAVVPVRMLSILAVFAFGLRHLSSPACYWAVTWYVNVLAVIECKNKKSCKRNSKMFICRGAATCCPGRVAIEHRSPLWASESTHRCCLLWKQFVYVLRCIVLSTCLCVFVFPNLYLKPIRVFLFRK